ncbi:MAG: SMP-30/gluconolactonase/LRE family protein [Verrucomicrobia bacterium]|nr:SMP-30/gluconolactonase/LRE family protein [Verrucomicrobiota bacterium]
MLRLPNVPFVALLVASAAQLWAADPAPAADEPQTPGAKAVARLQPLLKARPQDPTLYFYVALYHARDGLAEPACVALRKMQEFGHGLLPARNLGFEKIEKDEDYRRIWAELELAQPKVTDGKVAFRLPDRKLTPEGIAYDADGKRFFIGSIAQRRIVQVDASGKMQPFTRPGEKLDSVVGLTVDAPRRRLVAVTTSCFTEEGRKQPRNRLIAFDLASGQKSAEFDLTEADQLNDVTAAADGTLYTTDSGNGAVWRVAPDGKISAVAEKGGVRSANGLALSGDGRLLYVAHGTGVAVGNLTSGEWARLAPPPRESIAAIDGLYWHEGALLGIQNCTNPGRVIRLALAPDGQRVTGVEVLQSHHHPAFDEPTTGAIADGAFYVLATTQVARYNEKGEHDDPATLKEPAVVRVALPRERP